MLNILLNFNKNMFHGPKQQFPKRYFYKWLIIIFNGVDPDRVKKFGPDRACAEWLLRNGASVKWKGVAEYVTDYNALPSEQERFYIQAVDATDSAIHHIGFPHFSGCKYIEEIKLVRCSYIENEAMSLLSLVKDSLKHLEVVECKNITDEALLHLKNLSGLSTLRLGGMPYVEKKDAVLSELKNALPHCTITYD